MGQPIVAHNPVDSLACCDLLQPHAGGVVAGGNHQHDQLIERYHGAFFLVGNQATVATGVVDGVGIVGKLRLVVQLTRCNHVENPDHDGHFNDTGTGKDAVGIHGKCFPCFQMSHKDADIAVKLIGKPLQFLLQSDF